MSAIIRDIINQAAQLPGIIAADEVLDGTDSALAIIKLNEILAQLNVDQLFPYSRKVVSYQIANPKLKYTMGVNNPSSADIVEERPCFINRILFQYQNTSSPLNIQQLDLPDLLLRQSSVNAVGSPAYFAVNPLYPLVDLYFDCKPQAGSTISIVYNASIPTVTINDTLAIPPEYNSVLVTGLSRELCVLKQMPNETLANVDILYKTAISRVTANNSRNQLPVLDLGGFNNNAYVYNAIGVV